MSQVNEIVSLQAIDDEAAAFRAALEDVERRLRGNEELDGARRQLAISDAALKEARIEQRGIEAQVESLTSKIDPEERRLYDGSVKNIKELQNIQHELESLKERRSAFEEQLLEIFSRVEIAERERSTCARTVARLEALWEKDQQDLRHEARRLGDLIVRTDRRREEQKVRINPRALHLYEDVRRRRGGNAIARVQGGVCSGCRIAIPEGLRKRAFSSDALAQCPNCERILSMG